MTTDERLQQLLETVQTELAFQGESLHALSDAMARQQGEILELRRAVQLLQARLREQHAAGPEEAADGVERPPHY